jgi:hypothetical protein
MYILTTGRANEANGRLNCFPISSQLVVHLEFISLSVNTSYGNGGELMFRYDLDVCDDWFRQLCEAPSMITEVAALMKKSKILENGYEKHLSTRFV